MKKLLPLVLSSFLLFGCELFPSNSPTPEEAETATDEQANEDAQITEDETQAPTASTPTGAVGETLTGYNGANYTLVDVNYSAQDPALVYTPDEGNVFLYCTVQIANASNNPLYFSGADWRIVQEAGGEFSVNDMAMTGVANELSSGWLEPGATIEGTLSFEVLDTGNLSLYVYGPLVYNSAPLAMWNITR